MISIINIYITIIINSTLKKKEVILVINFLNYLLYYLFYFIEKGICFTNVINYNYKVIMFKNILKLKFKCFVNV